MFLLGVVAQVGERQHRDRRFLGQLELVAPRRWHRLDRGGGARPHPVSQDRFADVLERLLAEKFEGDRQLVADRSPHRIGHADAAGFGQAFEAVGDVDVVAEDLVAIDDDLAEVDADAKLHPALLRQLAVAQRQLVGQARVFGNVGVEYRGEFTRQLLLHRGRPPRAAYSCAEYYREATRPASDPGASRWKRVRFRRCPGCR